jgi:hypothetical protein
VKGVEATSPVESIYRGGDRLGRRSAILGRMTGQPEMILN